MRLRQHSLTLRRASSLALTVIFAALLLPGEVEAAPTGEDIAPLPRAQVTAPTVIFAILDTVRADHTSVCGSRRATTPYLRELQLKGAAVACRAYAPGDWSLPSHASLFTGRSVPEHGAHYARRDDKTGKRVGGLLIQPLSTRPRTLAEEMASRGYQTVLASANALLGPHTGLSRGFEISAVRPAGPERGPHWVHEHLLELLRDEVNPQKPMFLVINLLDAHDPWLEPPAELGWSDLDDQAARLIPLPDLKRWLGGYWGGALNAAQTRALRSRLADLYDYGVYREDLKLREIMSTLEEAGWLRSGFRMVVTSDHGEMLAEHDLWRHSFLWEGNVRVPFLYHSDGGQVELREPFPAVAAKELLLEGKLPSPLPLPHSVSVPNPELSHTTPAYKQDALAMWSGNEKLLWMGGEYFRFDLERDPDETSPHPLSENHPLRTEIEALVSSLQFQRELAPKASPELIEQLKSLGYL